jgi:hypothetical protein
MTRSTTQESAIQQFRRIHLEFFFSKKVALKRHATIKRLHPLTARKTAVRPFFRPNGETQIHEAMIKDFTPDAAAQAEGSGNLSSGFHAPNSRQRISKGRCQNKTRKAGPNTAVARREISETQRHEKESLVIRRSQIPI